MSGSVGEHRDQIKSSAGKIIWETQVQTLSNHTSSDT